MTIDLSVSNQFSYLVVIKDLVRLEFNQELDHSFNFEGYSGAFQLTAQNSQCMSQFLSAMQNLRDNYEEVLKDTVRGISQNN